MANITKGWTKPIPVEQLEYDGSTHGDLRELTKDDIDELHLNLAASYQCEQSCIDYDFEKVSDTLDEDHNNAIRLVFFLNGREIFNIKMAIPEELKQMVVHLTQ